MAQDVRPQGPVIEGEFRVLDDEPPPQPLTRWTFWSDDLPALAEIIAFSAGAFFLSYWVHRLF